LTQASASTTYLTQISASTNYLTQASASTNYLTQSSASTTYLTQSSASSTYLSQANAAITYLTQSSASSSYLTQDSASATYAKISIPIYQKTSSYTIGSAANGILDNGSLIEMGGTSTNNIVIPSDGTNGVTFPIGSQITILQTSSIQTTISGSGVTLNATPGLKLRTQWSSATLIKRGANLWVLVGDLTV
jgi:hypothetical protein